MLRNMRYIYEVYSHKSFSKAAQALFISQSSLSITIKNTEKNIGMDIFDRSTKPISLTKFGERYISAVEEIYRITKELEVYIDEVNEYKTGSLTIGAASFCVTHILPKLISRFHEEYPNVSINLVEASTGALETMLLDGKLDFIITSNAISHKPYQSFPLYSENFCLVVPEIWVTDEKKKALDQFHPLAVFPDVPYVVLRKSNNSRILIDNLFHKYRIVPRVLLETNQNITACNMACSGIGATVVSDVIAQEICPGKPVCCFSLNDPEAHRTNYISARCTDGVDFLIREFIRIAQANISHHNGTL